jgi:hypothetical protein
MDTTFRVVNLVDRSEVGQTAISPELAKIAATDLSRSCRMGLERTDWTDHFGKPKVHRTVLLEAENQPGEWVLGA